MSKDHQHMSSHIRPDGTTEQTGHGKVEIRNVVTGEVIERHFIDAREAVSSGEWEETDTHVPPLPLRHGENGE